MKLIRTKLEQDKLIKDNLIELDESSKYVLIEKGMESEPGFINIVFEREQEISSLLTIANYYKSRNFILGKRNEELIPVQVQDIIYIEGLNNDTFVYTKNDTFTVKEKLYELEKVLYDQKFVRVSKSFIASIKHIERIKPTFNGKLLLIMSNDLQLEVTRHYLKAFRDYLGF
jgi:DNA-binding LytR/AlgR family response regulator